MGRTAMCSGPRGVCNTCCPSSALTYAAERRAVDLAREIRRGDRTRGGVETQTHAVEPLVLQHPVEERGDPRLRARGHECRHLLLNGRWRSRLERMSRSRTNQRCISESASGTEMYANAPSASSRGTRNRSERRTNRNPGCGFAADDSTAPGLRATTRRSRRSRRRAGAPLRSARSSTVRSGDPWAARGPIARRGDRRSERA